MADGAQRERPGRGESTHQPAHARLPTQAFIYQNGRMQRLGLPGETSGAGCRHQRSRPGRHDFTGADNSLRGAIIHPAGPPTVLSDPGGAVVPGRHQQSRPGLRQLAAPTDTRSTASSTTTGG